ncbi:MAG: hypothetical protein AVDCRST_MAG86-4110 [uncultured Truepera sp.]|uniref:Uncharacterized protein n=1 Tax=uncultured Truepera sp. TaxID=543023 RepID=A0A6J4VVX0_9DEIN|nr:MAG: hypothetical protein AVDCRST_MAG86-4110 [uncultured Truepera sp.]
MTTPEIRSFIQRLTRRELIPGELAALTTRDLDDINAYLAECAEVTRAPYGYGGGLASATSRSDPAAPRRTYTEAEILAEFGVLR